MNLRVSGHESNRREVNATHNYEVVPRARGTVCSGFDIKLHGYGIKPRNAQMRLPVRAVFVLMTKTAGRECKRRASGRKGLIL